MDYWLAIIRRKTLQVQLNKFNCKFCEFQEDINVIHDAIEVPLSHTISGDGHKTKTTLKRTRHDNRMINHVLFEYLYPKSTVMRAVVTQKRWRLGCGLQNTRKPIYKYVRILVRKLRFSAFERVYFLVLTLVLSLIRVLFILHLREQNYTLLEKSSPPTQFSSLLLTSDVKLVDCSFL